MWSSNVRKYKIIDGCINETKTWQASDALIIKREARYVEFDMFFFIAFAR